LSSLYLQNKFKMIEQNDFAKYKKLLNDPVVETRLANLAALAAHTRIECKIRPAYYVNNHIHTTYSFSPYSPTMVVWLSYLAGLQTTGIIDHETVSGVAEFVRAGEITGIPVSKGVECRVDFSGTSLKGKFMNNPDQPSIAYVILHGIPTSQLARIESFFAPYRQERNKRNRLMVEKFNLWLAPFDLALDYDQDVLALSQFEQGGTVVDRHILYALALKILQNHAQGQEVITFLQDRLHVNIPARSQTYLSALDNPFYAHDMLSVLKSSLSEHFYIPASTECPDVQAVLALAKETGSISTYGYLGDVTESVTNDKKPQKFEDAYLDELCFTLHELGFRAITYMPTRNSMEQINRLRERCHHYGFLQICGEDINSPRQPFVCEKLKEHSLNHLIDTTWALIGHEKRSNNNLDEGFFSEKSIARYPDLTERIQFYKTLGKMGSRRP